MPTRASMPWGWPRAGEQIAVNDLGDQMIRHLAEILVCSGPLQRNGSAHGPRVARQKRPPAPGAPITTPEPLIAISPCIILPSLPATRNSSRAPNAFSQTGYRIGGALNGNVGDVGSVIPHRTAERQDKPTMSRGGPRQAVSG